MTAKVRAKGRGNMPRIFMNGQAAAYSSFRRIQEKRHFIMRKNSDVAARYLAASCAHFAKELKNGFAAAGGSTSPVKAALNVTMCP